MHTRTQAHILRTSKLWGRIPCATLFRYFHSFLAWRHVCSSSFDIFPYYTTRGNKKVFTSLGSQEQVGVIYFERLPPATAVATAVANGACGVGRRHGNLNHPDLRPHEGNSWQIYTKCKLINTDVYLSVQRNLLNRMKDTIAAGIVLWYREE